MIRYNDKLFVIITVMLIFKIIFLQLNYYYQPINFWRVNIDVILSY